jgi:hypothetical protein
MVWIKRGFTVLASTLLVMLALILFALLAIAMRPLLIVMAIVGVFASWVLYHYSPAFREWFEAPG